MALLTKPNMQQVWASGGDIVEPSDLKKQQGWTVEVPPHQFENWIQNRQDEYLAHINQRGIPAWDGLTNYEAGGLSYVQGSDGKVYKSVAVSGPSSVVSNPTTDVTDTYWTIAFADVGAFLTQAAGDTRYTQRSNNLSDLTNVAAARTNLALGTAATATLTTSTTDGTVGRMLKVGDFGFGAGVGGLYGQDLNAYKTSGFYRLNPGGGMISNSPLGGAADVILLVTNAMDINSQTLWSYGTGAMYTRVGLNADWAPWREIAPIDSPAFTGAPTAPTASPGTNTTQLATTAFVTTADNLKANINSPTFTGVPSAPTASPGTNTTQLANTAFVKAAVDAAPMLGVGQTWQDVSGSRANGVTYTNTTGRVIGVMYEGVSTVGSAANLTINGFAIRGGVAPANLQMGSGLFIVPAGATYVAAGLTTVTRWTELR